MGNLETIYKQYIENHNLKHFLNRSAIYFEMRLFILYSMNLEISVWDGWGMFTKYAYRLLDKEISAEYKSWIYKMRRQSHDYSLKSFWNNAMRVYENHEISERKFFFDEKGRIGINGSCQICSDRLEWYREFLEAIPNEIKNTRRSVETELTYQNNEQYVMPIKGNWEKCEHLSGYQKKKQYVLEKAKDWNGILKEMGGEFATRPDILLKLNTSGDLQLKGVNHIVGTLGAGKSTFKAALLYDGVKKKGMRFAVIEDSIPKVISLAVELKKAGIQAVPFIGNSSEIKYLQEYMSKFSEIRDIITSEEIALLSGSCIVKSYVGDERPEYPCNQLRNETNQYAACPFSGECGHLQRYRALKQADVIIITPQAVVKSSVVYPVDNINRGMYELIYDITDVVIVDEADGIQRIFEEEMMIRQSVNRGKECVISQMEDIFSDAKADLGDDIAYAFHQNIYRIKSFMNMMERILKSSSEVMERYANKSIVPTVLRDEVLRGFEWPMVRLDGAKEDTSFEKEIKKYVEISDSFTIGEENLDCDIKHQMDLVQDIHWTNHLTPEKEMEKIMYDLLERYQVSFTGKYQKGKLKKFQFQKYGLLLLLVQLDSLFKQLCDAYSQIYVKERGYRKSISGYEKISVRMQHLITEPCLGVLFGYMLGFQNGKLCIEVVRYDGVGREILMNWPNIKEEMNMPGPAVLCMSGTSLAPASAHYHIKKEPDGILLGKPEGKIEIKFYPVVSENEYIRISGSNEYRRDHIQKLIVSLLTEIKYCLKQQNHRKIMIVCGSYREAKDICSQLQYENLHTVYVGRDEDTDHSLIHRKDIERIPEKSNFADICVVPLNIISRGYNILDRSGNSYFGTMFFLARPYMVPGDYGSYIQMLHFKLEDYIDQIKMEYPDFHNRLSSFRRKCYAKFHEIVNITTWKSLNNEQRDIMTWFILISMKQAIGRMQRNGNECWVYLCDSAFCDAIGKEPEDTIANGANSTVHAMEELLQKTISDNNTKILYQNLYTAIQVMNRDIEARYFSKEETDCE